MSDEFIESGTNDYYRGILAARSLLDKREVHLRQMITNLRLAVTGGPQELYYELEYCYHDVEAAWRAFNEWDGEEHPVGWFKIAGTDIYAEEASCRPR